MKRKIAVLGATGSIGKSTLDVISANKDDFEVVLLSAHQDIPALLSLATLFPESRLAITDNTKWEAQTAATRSMIAFWGQDGLLRGIKECNADIVVNGIAGAAGLMPSLTALESGADVALANKETIVMAGPLVASIAKKNHCRILPVDSEHSAVFHLLESHGPEAVEEVILTASGGPFRHYSKEQLEQVSLQDALNHPTWKMGGKITIDSASLANKGLEVIEAVRLFSLRPEQVSVLVHPQSYVHSLIRLRDGSLYAQVSKPDMRVPIHNALFWPEVRYCHFGRLDLVGQNLTFEKPRTDLFSLLPLAYEAAKAGQGYPIAYNASDEVAVAAFMQGRISFVDMGRIVAQVLEKDWTCDEFNIQSILDVDQRSRATAHECIKELHH